MIDDYAKYENKCEYMKYLLDILNELFISNELFNEFTIYLDNLSTINYIFNNNTNKIIFFCINHNDSIKNFLYTLNKLKQSINDKLINELQFISMVSNHNVYSQSNTNVNSYRQHDNMKFMCKHIESSKLILVELYFMNHESFFNEFLFNNLIEFGFFHNLKMLLIESTYYCMNDKLFYSISKGGVKNKINDIIEIINVDIPNIPNKSIVNDNMNELKLIDDIDEHISVNIDVELLTDNPYIFFDIFIHYLMTRNHKLKLNLEHIFNLYSNDKNVKKKIKRTFNFDSSNYTEKIYILINLIKNFLLDEIFLNIVKEFPIINKMLFGLSEELFFFQIDIYESFENYVITILFNKYDFFKKKVYLNYINKNCYLCEENKFGFDYGFDNKLELLRNIKNNIYAFNSRNISLKYHHFYKINSLCEILYVLLYATKKLNSNIEVLKLVYIFKKYYYMELNDINYIFNIYNKIIKNIGLDESYFICEDNYFYDLYRNKSLLIKLESILLINLTEINKSFVTSTDVINIYDIQDSIYIVWELLYLNKLDFNDEISLKNNLDDYLNSVLANVRSYKLLKVCNIFYDNQCDEDDSNYSYSINKKFVKNEDENYEDENYDNHDNYEKYEDEDENYKKYEDEDDEDDEDDNIFGIFFKKSLKNTNNYMNLNNIYENDEDDEISKYENDDEDDKDVDEKDNHIDEHDNNNHKILKDNNEIQDVNNFNDNNTCSNSNEIFHKFTNSIDNIICKINDLLKDEMSETSDDDDDVSIDLNNLHKYGELNDMDSDNDNFTNNFINTHKNELKYHKYKNKYMKLKKIYQIVQNEYFDINMFINQFNMGLSSSEIFNSILSFYEINQNNLDSEINFDIEKQDNNQEIMNNSHLNDEKKINLIVVEVVEDILDSVCFLEKHHEETTV